MKAGTQGVVVFAQAFHNELAFLGNDDGGFQQNEDDQGGEQANSNQWRVHRQIILGWK